MRGSNCPFTPTKTYDPVSINLREKWNLFSLSLSLVHFSLSLSFCFFLLHFLPSFIFLSTRTSLLWYVLLLISFSFSIFSFLSFSLLFIFIFYFPSFSLFYLSFLLLSTEWSKCEGNFPPLSSIATCLLHKFS